MFRLSLFALLLLCRRTAALMQYKPLRTIRAHTRHLKLQSALDTKDDGKQSDRLFADWEDEELQQAQSEKLNEVQQMRDEFGYQSLPAYALKWLKDFETDDGAAAVATPASKLPTMVIVGRPNTGKSTLVNRISGVFKEGAIVHDEPGITRDRTYRVAQYGEYNFQVVDTGGIIFDDNKDVFADRIIEQANIALQEASVAVVVCDGMEGVTPLDEILVDWLRKSRKIPILLAVNKCESEKNGFLQSQEFWKLGVGTPYPVSGIHGSGVYDLLDAAAAHLPKVTNILAENITNVALVGRPNVGKSSLLNRLYGQSRAIVSDVAGTTRDTVDVLVNRGHNRTYRIIDTAGIRKRGKIEYGPEFFMINRAFKAIRRSDCVVLLLDAVTGIVDQDRVLAQRIADEGRACVIALNKWDAIPNKTDKSYLAAIENVRAKLSALRWADIVLISALQGQRTEKLFESIDRATQQFNRRIPTGVLNEVVTDATLWMAPPSVGGRSGRIYYCMQISAAPPTIVLFVNDPELFTDAYKRYLERKIRDSLNFEGTPIKLIWRGKSLRSVSRSAQRGEIGELTSKAVKSSRARNE